MESLQNVRSPESHSKAAEHERFVQQFGTSSLVADEILLYLENRFHHGRLDSDSSLPLPDEEFIVNWEVYAQDVEENGFAAAARWMVQLSFPIQSGMAQNQDYVSATRRGAEIANLPAATGISMLQPQCIRLLLHRTWAGRIPVWVAACHADFVSLVSAFSRQNEPVTLPDSMGACLISSYNNIARFREGRTQRQSPLGLKEGLKYYQDRFIILKRGPYSGLPAETLGLEEREWNELSLVIRREHECAHYCTKRLLGYMSNSLMDEIIADSCGIVSAIGRFKASWLLAFLGIDQYPEIRPRGRVHNYRGNPALSDDAFALIQGFAFAAITNLGLFYDAFLVEFAPEDAVLMLLLVLTRLSLDQLASDDAFSVLAGHLFHERRHLSHATGQKLNRVNPSSLQEDYA